MSNPDSLQQPSTGTGPPPTTLQSGWLGAAFVAPAVLWVLVFTVFPLLYSLSASFRQQLVRFDRPAPWIGLENYKYVLADPEIRHSIVFTISIVVLSVVGEVVLGFGLAMLAYRLLTDERSGWLKAVFTTPMLAAPVAIAYLSITFFEQSSGLLNQTLSQVLPADALPRWRTDQVWALVAIVLVDWWQWTPFCFLIFSAALAGVPGEALEAAEVEGAGTWTMARSILLPLTMPAVLTVLLIRWIEALKVFDVPMVLTPGAGTSTYTYTQWIWRIAMRDGNYGRAASLGYLLLIPVLLGAMFLVHRSRRVWE